VISLGECDLGIAGSRVSAPYVHLAVTVVVTVTVRKDPITGTTVLPAAVGAGAVWRTIEKSPKGIVTSAGCDPLAGAGDA
jgi:hypothetical protein